MLMNIRVPSNGERLFRSTPYLAEMAIVPHDGAVVIGGAVKHLSVLVHERILDNILHGAIHALGHAPASIVKLKATANQGHA